MTRRQWLSLAAGAAAMPAAARANPAVVFRAGEEGYSSFRIPALLATRKGTLLAFCEGRRLSRSDSGDIDLVLKRSTDQGATWSPLQVVADRGPDTIGNPCPVQERNSGRIFLPLTFNRGSVQERQLIEQTAEDRRRVFLTHSDDDGRTWAGLSDITEAVAKPDWRWYATGPGNGIQTRSGRLIIPCNHTVAGSAEYYSHVFYSDDGGGSWRIGGSAEAKTNECQVAELRGGELVLNMRSYHGRNRRAVARSRDGGQTWSPAELDQALIEPVCQASLIAARGVLYFSNPAFTRRERMTLRASRDGGRTWNAGLVLHAGPAAYSSLAELKGRRIGCLYECGEQNPYQRIVFESLQQRELLTIKG